MCFVSFVNVGWWRCRSWKWRRRKCIPSAKSLFTTRTTWPSSMNFTNHWSSIISDSDTIKTLSMYVPPPYPSISLSLQSISYFHNCYYIFFHLWNFGFTYFLMSHRPISYPLLLLLLFSPPENTSKIVNIRHGLFLLKFLWLVFLLFVKSWNNNSDLVYVVVIHIIDCFLFP